MTTIPDAPARGMRLPRPKRREQLILAARVVFCEKGYHATVMDDIAERAGVSKPVLYQHFPGKLDLYLALLDDSAEQLLTRLHEALLSTTDNSQRVTATVTAYFDFVDDPGSAHRLLFESDITAEPAVSERLERFTMLCAQEIAKIITEDTGLPVDESTLLAIGLVGIAQVTARYWLTTDGSIPRTTAAELVATLGWRGIRGFPMREE
jgi:AcrR family transcriptional regulator